MSDDLDGVGTELGEVLDRGDGVHESKAASHCDSGVTQRPECLDDGRGTHATSILSKCAVPNTVQSVLDAPMEARQSKQMLGVCSLRGEAGDGVDRLRRGLMSDGPSPGDPAYLLDAGPSEVRAEISRTPQFPMFDPTVPFTVLDRVGDVGLPPPLLPGGKRAW